MSKLLVVDLDGTLAESYEYQEIYFNEDTNDEKGYLSHIEEFKFRQCILDLVNNYLKLDYHIFFLSARPKAYLKPTINWLRQEIDIDSPNISILLKGDQRSIPFKVNAINSIRDQYDSILIIEDDPDITRKLISLGYDVLLVPNSLQLYESQRR